MEDKNMNDKKITKPLWIKKSKTLIYNIMTI